MNTSTPQPCRYCGQVFGHNGNCETILREVTMLTPPSAPSPQGANLTPIATHFEMLMDVAEQERIGATADRPEHMRVMRVLDEYYNLQRESAQLRQELEGAFQRIEMVERDRDDSMCETGALRDGICEPLGLWPVGGGVLPDDKVIIKTVAALQSAHRLALERVAGLEEYAFGMESALRGARASGTASELSLVKAECAELRLRNHDLTTRAERDGAKVVELTDALEFLLIAYEGHYAESPDTNAAQLARKALNIPTPSPKGEAKEGEPT